MSEVVDQDIPVGFTRFPNLSPEECDTYNVTSIPWGTDGACIPLDVLVLSWAALLRSFTGEVHPTFVLDNQPVQADLSTWSFERMRPELFLQDDGGYCGIFTNSNMEHHKAQFAVLYDQEKGTGSLRSSFGTNKSYLTQIGYQLRHYIRRQLEDVGSQINLPAEEELDLSSLNPKPPILPGAKFLHHLIYANGMESTAIEFLHDSGARNKLSYRSLDSLSTGFSMHLTASLGSSRKEKQNDVIPILIPQSTNLYIVLLAILKAGAAFCPLNLDAPSERIAFILNDVDASLVVTTKPFAEKFQDVGQNITIISIDDEIETKSLENSFEPRELSPDSLAYVMYTSGSTGLPKGVGISHRAATQSLLAHNALIPSFTRFLQFAATTFDVSVFEIFFPLFRGATLVCCDRGMMLNDLPGIMRRLEVDAAELTPTVATELLRSRQAVPSLRVLLTIGEMLSRHVIREFGASPRSEGLLQGMYGPTEAAIHCTMAPNFKSNTKAGIIGSPLPSVSAHIVSIESSKFGLEDELGVLPVGHIGELAVGGHQLANSYLNRPDENAKSFVETTRYGRVYRTGDRARLLPSGDIEMLGRISGGQVKLRGQRLELGEIEHIVCKTEGIRNAVASVVEDILVVFVLTEDDSCSLEEIRQICRRWLPKFMIPGDIEFLTELPRLPSGKIDKKELERNYVLQKRNGSSDVSKFSDASESKIAACVEEIISARVNRSMSLSGLGLDSLTAIRLSAKLRDIGVDLDVAQILEADTVHGIWLAKERGDGLNSRFCSVIGTPGNVWQSVSQAGFSQLRGEAWVSEVEDVVPCAPVQISLLIESAKNPNAYFNQIDLEFNEGIEVSKVKEAFHAVAQHNEILRSSFIELDFGDNSYAQVIWKSLPESRFSISQCTGGHLAGELDGLINPFRVQLEDSGRKVSGVVRIHHALYDGWSWELILNDVQDILSGQALKLRSQYRILTELYQQYQMSGYLDSLGDYWQDQLQEVSPTCWPNFNTRSDVASDPAICHRSLDISLSSLDNISRELRIGRQTILQAAFAYILSTYIGSHDIVFGSVSSGRTLAVDGIEDIIGPCINTLPMRLNIALSRSVRDLLAVTHTLNRDFIKYGALPLGAIKKASGADPTRPLFDSLFIWQETLLSKRDSPKLVHEIGAKEFLEFAMTFEVELSGEKLTTKATYIQSIVPSAQVDIFLSQVEQVASLFMSSPDLLLTDINSRLTDSMLSIEKGRLEKPLAFPGLSSGVEKFAKEDPDRISIQFLHTFFDGKSSSTGIEKLTYRQLNNRANQLAHCLLDHGVGDKDLVGIVLERSIDFYVSVLAVIKSGSGYIPITPDMPPDSMQTLLGQTLCKSCITSSSFSHLITNSNFMRIIDIGSASIEEFPEHNVTKTIENSQNSGAAFTPGAADDREGVIVTHYNLQSNIAILSEIYPTLPSSRWLQACPYTFSESVFDIFFSWNSGMTLCSTTDIIFSQDIERVIRSMDITHLNLVPSFVSQINPINVPNVKFLATYGEELTPKVCSDWIGRGLYHGYNPSEMPAICTLNPNIQRYSFRQNIGKPLQNATALIVSSIEPFSLAPKGAIGEICFTGDLVCHASLDGTELTQRKFINHPKHGRLFRSGDLGRLLSDGSIIFVGHVDDQVRHNGQYIDFNAISDTVFKSAAVKDCFTMTVKDDNSDLQRLVTFWVPTEINLDISPSDFIRRTITSLLTDLDETLPNYMIPDYLFPIRSIPMKLSGRADKKKLIEDLHQCTPEHLQLFVRESETTEMNRPLSDIEEIITRSLANITHIQPVDINRNTSFFNLGLNSMSAISLSRRLRREGLDTVDISSVMRHSSVAQLSNMVSRTVANKVSASEPSVKLESIFDPRFVELQRQHAREVGKIIHRVIPCTPLQEAMLSRQNSSHNSAYYNHLTFEFRGDVDRLRSAWATAQARHDILRTCFITTNNARFVFAQIVLENIELPWKLVKTSTESVRSEVEKQKSGGAISESAYEVPYSLTIFTSDAGRKKFLLLSVHHALYDAEAMSNLLQDVETVYLGHPLPVTVPFDMLLQKMVNTSQEESDRFWDSYLDGLNATSLSESLWGIRRQIIREDFKREQLMLNFSLKQVEMGCRSMSTTILGLLQTAWARLLAIYTGETDVCFGNVFSCRTLDLEGAERIVGPCFNTLPVRVKLSENSTNHDLIKQLRKSNADILSHQLSSLRRIQQRHLTNGSRLFDSLLLLQNSPRPLNDNLWKLVEDEGDMDFPIVCEIIPEQQQGMIQVNFHYDASHMPTTDIRIVMKNYAHIIGQILQFPSARAVDPNALQDETLKPLRAGKATPMGVGSDQIPNAIPKAPEWSSEQDELVELLTKLSGVDRIHVSPETTIFQMGLDSVNAVQIAARLRERGFTVSAGDVLEAPSVRELSAFLLTSRHIISSQPNSYDFKSFERKYWPSLQGLSDVVESSVESLHPCTPVQAGMLAMFSHSGGDIYFNHIVYKVPLHFESDSLKEAWVIVSERNEMLRTGFIEIQDEKFPYGMITYRKGTFEIQWSEYSGGDDDLLSQERGRLSKKAFANMHRPPWYLTLHNRDSYKALQFSALHTIFDAQALELIVSEVIQAYHGEIMGRPLPVSTVLGPILSSNLLDSEPERFWKTLGKEFQVTKFPDLSPTHTQKALEVLTRSCSMPANSIDEGCRNAGITLTAAGQLSWARILAAYTGVNDVTYGLVLSGRNMSEEARSVVFPCLTTVPAPCRVEGSNSDVLNRIMRTNASLGKHQFTSLSKIHKWTNSDRGLFDTIFVHQKLSSPQIESEWEVANEEAKVEYPISIELVPKGNNLDYVLTFTTDILPRKQAGLLLEQLDSILINSIFSPRSNSAEFSNVDPKLLSITPAKEEKIQSPVDLLHRFVEVQAANNPSKPALEFVLDVSDQGVKSRKWSYQELDEKGNQYARMLQTQGASPGGLVGICLDKCPEAYFSILGILKAGCAYVALDPTAPISRKSFIVEDSRCKIIVCTSAYSEELKELPYATVIATDIPGVLDAHSSLPPSLDRPIRPDDTSYCLYTSGTTGNPKGCEITHHNAVQAMLAFQRIFSGLWDDSSRWLQFASFHFDVSVLEQYWSWGVGICVTSCPRDILFSDLPGVISKLEITHIDLTPSLARLITPREVPSLCRGVFITGGEQLKQEILDSWGERKVIYNGYGPTEATIGCTMLPRMSRNGKPSNIGPQFDNVGSFVFQPQSEVPVMRGCAGELCVSGPLVGRGYLNRPELTEERFRKLENHDERVYRTGDLVRILHDGSFSFLGRLDDQVKLRGQRLEIGEINEVIRLSATTIDDISTLVLKHPRQPKEQLVSFVVSSQFPTDLVPEDIWSTIESRLLISQIKTACSTRLPGYMVPTHIIPMSAFPLSPNNKIDSRKLKDMYGSLSLETLRNLSSTSTDKSEERTETLQKVAKHLSKFAGCRAEDIEPSSSIFALGLDSISVIAFARSLKKAGFTSADPSLIMNNPQVSKLSVSLGRDHQDVMSVKHVHQKAKQEVAAFVHSNLLSVCKGLGDRLDGFEGVAPCTPLQEGMIYRALESQGQLYYSRFQFQLAPRLDISRLKAAWASVQSSVDILRTRFTLTGDGYAQVVLRDDNLPWFDLNASSAEEVEAVINKPFRVLQNQANKGFEQGLWSVGVTRSPGKTFMSLNIFHGLFDGNSLPLLLRRVALEYAGKLEKTRAPSFLDALPLGPLAKIPKAQIFWTDHLRASTYRRIPVMKSQESTYTIRELDISGLGGLETVRRNLDVTEQSIVHACWLLTLNHHLGFIPTIGVIVSGRTLDVEDAEDIIGPMFNTIPSQVQFDGLSTVSGLIRRCHSYYASSLPFQHTPLRDISKWVGRTPDRPLFDSLFAFQRDNENALQETEDLWSSETSHAEPDYPLAFEARRRRENSFTISIATQPGATGFATTDTVLHYFRDTLLNIIVNPNQELPATDNSVLDLESHGDHTNENGYAILGKEAANSSVMFEWTPDSMRIRDEISILAGVDKSSIRENTSILEVGLDSIDAIKLSSRLNTVGIGLSVSTIMRCRTVENIMGDIVTNKQDNGEIERSSIDEFERKLRNSLENDGYDLTGTERILPPTPLQEAMVAEMISSGYTRYFNHEVLELEKDVHVDRLEQAWGVVINNHPILRTSFVEVSDPASPFAYAQAVHKSGEFDWKVVYAEESTIDSIINAEKHHLNENSANGPLLRLQLIIDREKRFLLLSIAHALYDGWSLNLLHHDVSSLYAGNTCARPSYHGILENILNSSTANAIDFWKSFLAGVQPAIFPEQPQSRQRSKEVHRKEAKTSVSLSYITSFCKSQGITIQALGMTCWALVLAGYLGKLDVVFGLILSGRGVKDGDRIMFPTMNTVSMRAILHGTRSQMLRYVQETIMNVSKYQHYPLRKAISDSRIGGRALFNTLFIYQKTSNGGQQPHSLYRSVRGSSDLEYPVCVEIEGLGESLVWRLACKDNVLGALDSEKLLERIQDIMEDIIYQPEESTVEFVDSGTSVCGSSIPHADAIENTPQNGQTTPGTNTEWGAQEQSIRDVFSAVSGVPKGEITKDMSLFHLGLDSISAIKVSSLLRKQSITLSVTDMLRAGPISNMAYAVSSGQKVSNLMDVNSILSDQLESIDTAHLLQAYEISPHTIQRLIPATSGQTYFLGMSGAVDEHVFYPDFFYQVNAQLSHDRLEEAWRQLVASLPILRTAFIPTGQRQLPFIQVVLKNVENRIVWLTDLATTMDNERPSSRSELSVVPVTLFAHQTSERLIVKLQIHHALYDAISLPKMMEVLAKLCHDPNYHAGAKVDMSEMVAFRSIHSPVEKRKHFWKEYLSEVEKDFQQCPRFPCLDTVRCYRQGLVDRISDIEETARLHGLSLQSLFLGAYAKLHAQLITSSSGESNVTPESVVIGMYLANRSHSLEGLPDLIAPSLNIVPLRIKNPREDSILQVARRIQADLHEIGRVEHSCVSLLEISDWTGIKLNTVANIIKLPHSEKQPAFKRDLELEPELDTLFSCGETITFVPLKASEAEKYVTWDNDTKTIKPRQPFHIMESGQEGQEVRDEGIARCRARSLPMLKRSGSNPYDDVYKPSIDVEAAIRDNRLDVGIFGPRDRISERTAVETLAALRLEIENFRRLQ